MKIDITIQNDLKGVRLDTIISNFSNSCSRTRAGYLLKNSHILVNKFKKKPGYRVKTGDIITGTVFNTDIKNIILPENIHLNIIFEDDHIIVINKEPGMVTHPAPGNMSGTLVNALLSHEPAIKLVGEDPLRSGIVHRLDKDTSGLMVVVKTNQALHFLQKEFKQRRVKKEYLALITGNLSSHTGQINLPIGRHPKKRKIMAINLESGKPAITCWKIKTKFQTACLVEALLQTGRTHQIRVHFYAINHPLIGDRVYQYRRYRKKTKIAPRQMLHSWQLSFRHPYSGKKMFFTSRLPEDFVQTIFILKA
jgi:23S rRNA pseudouridine1911/1915/1917 synthase